MIASQICSKLKSKIYNKQVEYGYIHSVFSSACNIISNNNKLITLLLSENNIGPMTISINSNDSFLKLGFKKDAKVIFDKNSILICDINLKIELSQAKIWKIDPSFNYKKVNEQQLLRNIRKLEVMIFKYGKKQGVGHLVLNIKDYIDDLDSLDKKSISLNSNDSFIIDNFLDFLKDVINNNVNHIDRSARGIIGFGLGLTPSMDDFVTGLMISLIYLCDYYQLDKEKAYKLNRMITRSIKNRTTIISESMLMHAQYGYVMDDLRTLMILLLSDSEKDMSEKIMDVLAFGSTSGTDLLCGVYIGSKIMINEKNWRWFSNENKY